MPGKTGSACSGCPTRGPEQPGAPQRPARRREPAGPDQGHQAPRPDQPASSARGRRWPWPQRPHLGPRPPPFGGGAQSGAVRRSSPARRDRGPLRGTSPLGATVGRALPGTRRPTATLRTRPVAGKRPESEIERRRPRPSIVSQVQGSRFTRAAGLRRGRISRDGGSNGDSPLATLPGDARRSGGACRPHGSQYTRPANVRVRLAAPAALDIPAASAAEGQAVPADEGACHSKGAVGRGRELRRELSPVRGMPSARLPAGASQRPPDGHRRPQDVARRGGALRARPLLTGRPKWRPGPARPAIRRGKRHARRPARC